MPTRDIFPFVEDLPEDDYEGSTPLRRELTELKAIDKFKYLAFDRPFLEQTTGDLSVSFWFGHSDTGSGPYALNNPNISNHDWAHLMAVMKKLSNVRVLDVMDNNLPREGEFKVLNFHPVTQPSQYPNLLTALRDLFQLDRPVRNDDCPHLFQVGLYNSDSCVLQKEPKKAPRLFMKLTAEGTLSVLLLDLYHELCPAKDRSSHPPTFSSPDGLAR